MLSFHDEDLDHLCDLIDLSSNIHYLGIECRDISVLLQVIFCLEKSFSVPSYF